MNGDLAALRNIVSRVNNEDYDDMDMEVEVEVKT